MDARAIRAALAARGITLRPGGGPLLVAGPPAALTDEDRDLLRRHRVELLSLLLDKPLLALLPNGRVVFGPPGSVPPAEATHLSLGSLFGWAPVRTVNHNQ